MIAHRRALFLSFSLIGLAASLVLQVSAEAMVPPTINISMTDNVFMPQNLRFNAGSIVVWTNNGLSPHTTTSDTGLWDSGILSRGQTFSRSFDTPGTYPYSCVLHRGPGMVGVITVVGTAQPTVTPTASPLTATATPATGSPTPTALPGVTPVLSPGPVLPGPSAGPFVAILSPALNQTFTGAEGPIRVQVQVANFVLAPESIGQANQPGRGHWHLILDGNLAAHVGTESYSLGSLSPGAHTIIASLRNNDNFPLNPPVSAATTIIVAPTVQPPLPTPSSLPATGGEGSPPPWALLAALAAIPLGVAVRLASGP